MRKNENIKKMVLNSILLAIGLLLHQITPTLGLPMQPDFSLVMLFIVIILNNGEYKVCLLSGIIIGLFTAITTKFPGGQIPNMIDKLVTLHVVYFLIFVLNKIKIENIKYKKATILIKAIIIFSIGTLVSGLSFLISANFIVGLPASFMNLFLVVVVPAVVMNMIVGLILFKTIERATQSLKITFFKK